jgi:hypothetical protein
VRFMSSRAVRLAVPTAAFGLVVGVAGAVLAVTADNGTDHSAFVVDALYARPAVTAGSVSQSVANLWSGKQVQSYTKTGGSDWLSVDKEGLITGTAPATAPSQPGLITVSADDGTVSDTISVAVPVVASGQRQRLEAASWNLDDAGNNASSSAERKQVRAIVSAGIQVLGMQESGGTLATALAKDLGWFAYQSSGDGSNGGDLGLISAYPISQVTAPTAAIPALGATLDVNGEPVRVWTAHLDESGYGPHAVCFDGRSGAQVVAAEQSSTRVAQANAIAAAMHTDIAAAGGSGTPVILLGDLASPSGADWTSATSSSHCNAGAVAWPAPAVFAAAGLSDSYRAANADPASAPGNTWSPLTATDSAGRREPQDRIDYVQYAGRLTILGAESYFTGMTSDDGDLLSQWPSDHAAAVTVFELADPLAGGSATVPLTLAGPLADGSATVPLTSAGTPTAGAPLAHGKPHIRGVARVGGRLKAVVGWRPAPTLTYRWYAGGKVIDGATKRTFIPHDAQRGKRITVQVTGVRAGYTTVIAASRPTTPVS